jgi:ABC-type sugar transport system permease subunit
MLARPERSRWVPLLGRQPVGLAFAAPYAVFLAAVFAYPLGLAIWISFHDYFFAAPGAQVDRPFVGFENYATVLGDPAVRRSFVNVAEFLVINVPLTVALSLALASALNSAIRGRAFLRMAVVRERMHWVAAEATATAAALFTATGGPSYADVFIDTERGSWHHELDPQNRPSSLVWAGKPDTYYAFQATLIRRLPLTPTLAAALRDGLLG